VPRERLRPSPVPVRVATRRFDGDELRAELHHDDELSVRRFPDRRTARRSERPAGPGDRQEWVQGRQAGAATAVRAMRREAIFHEFTRRAFRAEAMPKLEAYMRMALKAQQQSASTLRVLGELKNPRPVEFVKQANIANGPQQVNNNAPASAISGAVRAAHEENGNRSNELLEHHDGEWLDTGAAGEAGRGDQAMEAVGAVNRAGDR
jgi:hypothetical protein